MIETVEQVLQSLDEIRTFLTKCKVWDAQFKILQLKDLLHSESWPVAVPQELICMESEDDLFERADSIINFSNWEVDGKKFLDFGCGLGHVAVVASQLGSQAAGYDIVESSSFEWEKEGKYLLTTNFDKIKAMSPFDFIMLYDVLDHSTDPVGILTKVREVANKNTDIFVRCHPFLSRHGGHLYKHINKAYVHLVFTEDELQEMGYGFEGNFQKTNQPLVTYRDWFKQANLSIVVEDVVQDVLEPFFKKGVVKERMPKFSFDGVWEHYVNGRKHRRFVAYPNGTLNTPQGPETWSIDGLNLSLRWPTDKGIWRDELKLNEDMTHYEGTNQIGYKIKGDRIENINSSFIDFTLRAYD
ncbi:MAG: class I SAM-dependent methyltransferase [Proteobacteria bacterium]|jgi:2-polyprenyl-3-methyl-5-hydroxy-6-metoxy-1,4-benzoquinol methylase|nr:class I SAM-dependent methyltransferase [Pseudomonadota bacterium]